MSSPASFHSSASSAPPGAGAVPPVGAARPRRPGSQPRRLVSAILSGLRRTNQPEPVDLGARLRTNIRSTIGHAQPGAAQSGGLEGVLGDEAWARAEIHRLFPGMPDDSARAQTLLIHLLEPHTLNPQPLPRYGNAPRYANGVLFSHGLARATQGDWARTERVLNAWRDPSAADGETRHAHFATHCALAGTDSGRDVLDALGRSPYWGYDDTDQTRFRATLMLAASGELMECARDLNLPDAPQDPCDLNDASLLAHAVLEAAPDEVADRQAAGTYGRAVIAARALLGMANAQPTFEQREAIALFRGALHGHGVADTEQLARATGRVNRMWGNGDNQRGWWSRATRPAGENRMIGALVQSSVQGLRECLHERLAPPTLEENGRQVPDPSVTTELTDDVVRDALEYGVLTVVADRIDKKGEFRETIRLRSASSAGRLLRGEFRTPKAERQALQASARLLGVSEDELINHPVWRAGWDELGTRGTPPHPGAFGASDLAAYMDHAGLDPDDPLRQPAQTAEAMRGGFATRNDAMESLVQTMRPGSSIAFTSQGLVGINTTWWTTLALNVLSRLPIIPTITPLPTVAAVKGRGAAVVVSGDEGPEGGYMYIHSGTFDRKQLAGLLGVVGQGHDRTNYGFAWVVAETGWHGHNESHEGATICVTGGDFREAQQRTAEVLHALRNPTRGGDGTTPWQRLVHHENENPQHVLIGTETRHTEARGRIALQLMGILGVNVPIASEVGLPNTTWVAPAVQYSRTSGTETTTSQGLNQVVSTQARRERHITRGGLAFPIPVFFQVGALANQVAISGGHGAYWMPLARSSKTFEHSEAMLCLPGPGVESAPFREFTMDEDTWFKWSSDANGDAQPQPPAFAYRQSLPDAGAARGARTVVVRQYLTPAARGQLRSYQHVAATLAAGAADKPYAQQEKQKWDGLTGELLLADENWGATEVWDQHVTMGGRAGGPPPLGIQAQTPQATVRRERRYVAGRQGGRTPLIGTRFPEFETSTEYNERVAVRNQPLQYVNPQASIELAKGKLMSPMQHTLAQIFEHLPKGVRIEPVIVPTPADDFGLLFHLVQMRNHIYPEGSEIRNTLNAFLDGTDSKAFADAVPMHDPETIMQDFLHEAQTYQIRHARTPEEMFARPEDLPEHFWSAFDIAPIVERHFERPVRGLQTAYEALDPNDTLLEHITKLRGINLIDTGSASPYSSKWPMPEDESAPSARFDEAGYWDRLLDAEGRLAAGDDEGVRRMLRNMASEAMELGMLPNAQRTYYFGREQAHVFALIAERYADVTGDEAFLAALAPAMLAAWRTTMRGADEQMMPGRIYNSVVMLSDGRLLNVIHDYGQGPRPEGYPEDIEIERSALSDQGVNPRATAENNRDGAASGIDFSVAQRNPDDGRRELNRMIPLQQNAHLAETELVLVRALRAKGDNDLADLMQTWREQRLQAMRDVFFAPATTTGLAEGPNGVQRFGTPLGAGSYFRLGAGPEGTDGVLHPMLSAEVANALWARDLAPPEAVNQIVHALGRLQTVDGLRASEAIDSPEQWDGDNYWAMHAYKAVVGLLRHHRNAEAEAVAVAFAENAWQAYVTHGATFEKYGPNGEPGGGGEYAVEPNMTMTNEALQYFASLFPRVREILERPIPPRETAA